MVLISLSENVEIFGCNQCISPTLKGIWRFHSQCGPQYIKWNVKFTFIKCWLNSEVLGDPGILAGILLDKTETYDWHFQQPDAFYKETYGRDYVLEIWVAESGPFTLLKVPGAALEDIGRHPQRKACLPSASVKTGHQILCIPFQTISQQKESLGGLPDYRLSHHSKR